MNTNATPETDELIRTQLARVGITPTALASKLTLKCEDLERERNDALKTQERVKNWKLMTAQELRLTCGEITAQEIRTIRAVLDQILSKNEKSAATGGEGKDYE
jgi:hypothetical protein